MQVVIDKNSFKVLNPNFNSETFRSVIEDFVYSRLDSYTIIDRDKDIIFLTGLIVKSLCRQVREDKEAFTFEEVACNNDIDIFPNAKSDDILIDTSALEVELCHTIQDLSLYAYENYDAFRKFQKQRTLDT